jgi:sulfur-carrier protein
MPTVFIPAQLRELSAGVQHVEISATNLRQVLAALDERFPGMRARLCTGEAISPGLAVSIDGAMVSKGLLSPVKPNSEVHFLPAIGGG